MSSSLLVTARGLTKTYGPPRSTVARLVQAMLRRPPTGKTVKAVDGVDFDISSGETVGIMGPNGAGKTTLLAMLGNVVPATSGTVERLGRVATLLETGAGFHPDLSGRENAELFNAMLGVPGRVAARHVEWVREFADLGRYFEVPIRTYSSGMQARLGFACAISVDADLMIVDEALAVGDAQFRQKCYAMIQSLQKRGRSFLVVSHSPHLILQFCSRALVLDRGRKVFDGQPAEAVALYRRLLDAADTRMRASIGQTGDGIGDDRMALDGAIRTSQGRAGGETTEIVSFSVRARAAISRPALQCRLFNHRGVLVFGMTSGEIAPLARGERRGLEIVFTQRLLGGTYFLELVLGETPDGCEFRPIRKYDHLARFDVARPAQQHGIVDLDMRIEFAELGN